MANMGRALLAGLVGGFSQYAGMKMDEKTKAEQAERDQKLAQLQMQLKQSEAKFSESLKPNSFQTVEETDPTTGRTIKKTYESGYNRDTGKFRNEVASAVQPMEAPVTRTVPNGLMNSMQQFDRDTGKWSELGSGPRFAPERSGGNGESDSGKMTEDQYISATPERQRLHDQFMGRAKQGDEDARLKKIAVAQVNSRIKDIDKKEARDQKTDFSAYGIDPAAKDARKQLRNAVTAEIYGSYGIDTPTEPSVEVMDAGPGSNNAPPALFPDKQAAPKDAKAGASQDNPLPVTGNEAKPPKGTWVKDASGRVFKI